MNGVTIISSTDTYTLAGWQFWRPLKILCKSE